MKQGREEGIDDSKNCVLLAGHVLMRCKLSRAGLMLIGSRSCDVGESHAESDQ